MWQAHLTYPDAYVHDTRRIVGSLLQHADTHPDNLRLYWRTAVLWRRKYDEDLLMHRFLRADQLATSRRQPLTELHHAASASVLRTAGSRIGWEDDSQDSDSDSDDESEITSLDVHGDGDVRALFSGEPHSEMAVIAHSGEGWDRELAEALTTAAGTQLRRKARSKHKLDRDYDLDLMG